MRDVFPDEKTEASSSGDYPVGDAEAAHIRDGLEGQQVCPFCGVVSNGAHTICEKCTMENSAVARKATKLRIGPWYVLQHRNPAAPGMKWETLLAFVRKGRVKPQSIVRGPTSHQLWRFAAHVKGLSREFGVCFSCGGAVELAANLCPHCNRLQEPPVNPDTLLEGGEAEPRLPVFKELDPSVADESESGARAESAKAAAAAGAAAAEAEAVVRRKVREQEEAFAREQREAIAREREAMEREKQAAARDRDLVRREQEEIARQRESVVREMQALETERSAVARERDVVRRDRETAGGSAASAASPAAAPHTSVPPARQKSASPADTSVWELPEADPFARTRTSPAAASPAASPAAANHGAASPAAASHSAASHGAASHGAASHGAASPGATRNSRPHAAPADRTSSAGDGAPPRPRAQLQRDGFLSARDLAAAFRLNHAPSADYDKAARFGAGASSGDSFFPSDRPRGRTGLKIFLILLLLIVSVTTTAFAVSKELRDKVQAVWSQIFDPPPAKPSLGPRLAPTTQKDEDNGAEHNPDRSASSSLPGAISGQPQPATNPSRPPSQPASAVPPAPTAIASAQAPRPLLPTGATPLVHPVQPGAAPSLDLKKEASDLFEKAKVVEQSNLAEAVSQMKKMKDKFKPEDLPENFEQHLNWAEQTLKQK